MVNSAEGYNYSIVKFFMVMACIYLVLGQE